MVLESVQCCPWELRLTGGFELRFKSQVIAVPGLKERALLAFLALHPRRLHDRAAVAALLWSDCTELSALANLRQVLVRLKRAISQVGQHLVVSTRTTLKIDMQVVGIDVGDLSRRPVEAWLAVPEGSSFVERCTLLPEISAVDPAYDEWLAAERVAVRNMITAKLAGALETAAYQHRHSERASIARRIIALDPYDEAAHRALMTALHDLKLFALVASHYRSLANLLRVELQVDPDPDTKALFRKLTRHNVEGDPVITSPTQTSRTEISDTKAGGRLTIAIDRFVSPPHDAEIQLWASEFQQSLISMVTGLCHVGILAATVGQSASKIPDTTFESNAVALLGKVAANGAMLSVTVQIIRLPTGKVLWEERFDTPINDSSDVEDQIVAAIATYVDQEDRPFSGLLADRRLDGEYWVSLLKVWRSFSTFSGPSLEHAVVQSAQLSMQYPQAMGARQAYAYSLFHVMVVGGRPKTVELCRSIVSSAADLVRRFPDDPRSLSTLSMVLIDCEDQPQHAIDLALQSLALNPACPCSLAHLGDAYVMMGQHDKGLNYASLSVEKDPTNPGRFFRYAAMAAADFIGERWQGAQYWARKSLEFKPDYLVARAIDVAVGALQGSPGRQAGRRSQPPAPGWRELAESQALFRGAERDRFSAGLRLAGWET